VIVTVTKTESFLQEFEELFRVHYDLVHSTAYGVTGGREDAEDVVQTVFLRLLRREIPPDLARNPKAYLYRAVVNESLNIVRSHRRRPKTDLDDVQIPAPGSDSVGAEEIHRKLYEAIGRLKPKHAEILILRHIHEYSDVEIAKLLGRSRGTIAVSLYRSRAKLKKLLRRSFGGSL
jgi:RNA polymerase sigma-70 factor, ECF subfamily